MDEVLTLLLVEDSPTDARLLREALAEYGSGVVRMSWADSLAGAEGELSGSRFDAVLLDLGLPDSSGLESLQRTRRAAPQTAIVVLTGNDDDALASLSLRSGAEDYLVKGQFDARLVLRAVRYAIERKLAHGALQASEQRFHTAFRSSPDAIAITGVADGRIIDVNDAFATITGYTREECIGDTTVALGLWGGAEDRDGIVRDVRALGQVRGRELELRTKGGGTVSGLFSAETMQLGDDTVLLSTIADITARKRAEDALRASAERFRSLVEHLPQRVFLKDRDSVYVAVNANYAHALGLEPEDVIGKDCHAFHPRDLADRYRADDLAVMASGEVWDIEEEYETAGLRGWVRTIKLPYHDAHGRVAGVLGIFEDISTRKQAEADRQRLVQAAEQSSDGLAICDLNGNVLYANAAWCALTDTIAEEAVGHQLGILWREDIGGETRTAVVRALRGQEAWSGRWRLATRDQGVRVLDASVSPLLRADGQPEGAAVRAHDVTAIEELEAQLQQAQKLESLGALAGGVAHDLNNILMVVMGQAELLAYDVGEASPVGAGLEVIAECGKRATGLVRQLLAFSRKQVLRPVRLDLNDLIANLDKMLQRLIKEDVELRVVPQTDLWPVRADPAQLEQILLNLVVNARDALPAGGRITARTCNVPGSPESLPDDLPPSPRGYVLLSVEDNGVGMDRATMDRMFEPFFSTKGERGTGLGLATVYGIVRQSGGEIRASSSPGVGTTFRVYLPRAADDEAPTEREALHRRSVGPDEPATILVIEDDAHVRAFVCVTLGAHRYTVLEATSGSQAAALALEYPDTIDLVVSDVVMPGGRGPDAVAAIRGTRPGVRALYMSGYADDALADMVLDGTSDDLLEKPFSGTDLLLRVRDALGP